MRNVFLQGQSASRAPCVDPSLLPVTAPSGDGAHASHSQDPAFDDIQAGQRITASLPATHVVLVLLHRAILPCCVTVDLQVIEHTPHILKINNIPSDRSEDLLGEEAAAAAAAGAEAAAAAAAAAAGGSEHGSIQPAAAAMGQASQQQQQQQQQ
jgi:hypothetical protein